MRQFFDSTALGRSRQRFSLGRDSLYSPKPVLELRNKVCRELMDSDAGLRYSSDGHAADRPKALGTFKADKFERFGRQKPSGDGGTDMDTVLT